MEGELLELDTAKRSLLEDLLLDIEDNEPVVVFCRFRRDLDAVRYVAERLHRLCYELSGRKDELKEWQTGHPAVLAVQIQSGGEGNDFTRARYSFFYSLGFSLKDYGQALKRTHRPGQTRAVFHTHLVAKGTIDEKILKALNKGADVIAEILQEMKAA